MDHLPLPLLQQVIDELVPSQHPNRNEIIAACKAELNKRHLYSYLHTSNELVYRLNVLSVKRLADLLDSCIESRVTPPYELRQVLEYKQVEEGRILLLKLLQDTDNIRASQDQK